MSRVGVSLKLVAVLLAGGLGARAQVVTSTAAGEWYPADPAELTRMLDAAWQSADRRAGLTPPRKGLRAVVVPHAGMQYSGVVAASAYRLVDDAKTIIVLGFSHSQPLAGIAGVDADAYATPLGEIAIDREVQRQLGIPLLDPKEFADHSIEVQLPYLQHVAPQAAIVPVYVGQIEPAQSGAFAAELARRMEQGDLVIASSDFTHYGEAYNYTPFPLDEETPARLRRQALDAFEAIGSIDVRLFDRYLRQTGDTICGRGPIRLLMEALSMLDGETYMEMADLTTSGELTRDYSMSVTYGGLAFYGSRSYRVEPPDEERLLTSARASLESYLGGDATEVPVPAAERTDDVRQMDGVFVTVRRDGELRGCVGLLQSRTPLWSTVANRTLAAARSDPRFKPLSTEDGPVTLEVSLLTPLMRLRDWRQFRVGKGAVLLYGGKSSVLLPQIAEEEGWNRQEFLRNLALKAGLDPDAYRRPDALLYTFEAQVFAEAGPPPEDANLPGSPAAQ